MPAHAYRRRPFRPAPEQQGKAGRGGVAIVGGGPVGLTCALELAAHGIPSTILEEADTVSEGSRALCWSKRSLEILNRHGVAARMVASGYTWNTGRVFHGARELYQFGLQPQGPQEFPAFTNLQQYLAEEFLHEAVARQPLIEMRWLNRVSGVEPAPDHVRIAVETPAGPYRMEADWVVAADGARSSVRRALGLDFTGRVFEDHFLIADVDVHAELPNADRRFWFQPEFGGGDTALCHKQGLGMWRVDFQLGWNIDREAEKRPERVLPRVRAMLGDHPMEITWVSIYTFQARRLARFRHGRVIFAGDAAHQVSPFGARGGNSGIQDAENLAWKLAYVIRGLAPDRLLDSYDAERGQAADENIRITSRTTDFLTPRTPASRTLRDAVLHLAADAPFARALVNSGRLSTPTIHTDSPLSTPDGEPWAGGPPTGAPCPNLALAAPDGFLLHHLGGGFRLLIFLGEAAAIPPGLASLLENLPVMPAPGIEPLLVARDAATGPVRTLRDDDGSVHEAFAAQTGTAYLIRPDQHVAARWRTPSFPAIAQALARALGMEDKA
ncbi:MAG: FAD-dependent oxidoreductase [Alphaproteobacteria bacterium]|nr:FAD-dependent oxidoreductase [Alphaproteobacteria bacterium]